MAANGPSAQHEYLQNKYMLEMKRSSSPTLFSVHSADVPGSVAEGSEYSVNTGLGNI